MCSVGKKMEKTSQRLSTKLASCKYYHSFEREFLSAPKDTLKGFYREVYKLPNACNLFLCEQVVDARAGYGSKPMSKLNKVKKVITKNDENNYNSLNNNNNNNDTTIELDFHHTSRRIHDKNEHIVESSSSSNSDDILIGKDKKKLIVFRESEN